MGNQDHAFGEIGKARFVLAHQLSEHAALKVEHIVGLLAENIVADGEELVRHLLEAVGNGEFNIDLIPADAVAHRSEQGGILKQSKMETENLCGFAAQLLLGAVAEDDKVRHCVAQCAVESCEFGVDLMRIDVAVRDMRFRLTKHEDTGDDDSGRNRNALHGLHRLRLGLGMGHRGAV